MFFLEEKFIMDKNVFCHFMYLHIYFKIKDYFYKKAIRVFRRTYLEEYSLAMASWFLLVLAFLVLFRCVFLVS